MSTELQDGVGNHEIDVRALFAKLWSGWKWILLSTFTCTAISAAVAFLTTPIYRASVVFVAAEGRSSGMSGALGAFGGLASLAGVTMSSNESEVEESLAVLKSRRFTERFLQENNLPPLLFSERWDERNKIWKKGAQPPTLAMAYKYFDQRIRSSTHDKKTGLFTLSIEWRNAEQAADWANDLVRRINAEMRSRAIEKASTSLSYLEREQTNTSLVAEREAINRLVEAQVKKRMLANVTDEYIFSVIDAAQPPDYGDVIKPKKVSLLGMGLTIGFFIGAAIVLAMPSGKRN